MKYYIVIFSNKKLANEAKNFLKDLRISNILKLFILKGIYKKRVMIKQVGLTTLLRHRGANSMVYATTRKYEEN